MNPISTNAKSQLYQIDITHAKKESCGPKQQNRNNKAEKKAEYADNTNLPSNAQMPLSADRLPTLDHSQKAKYQVY